MCIGVGSITAAVLMISLALGVFRFRDRVVSLFVNSSFSAPGTVSFAIPDNGSYEIDRGDRVLFSGSIPDTVELPAGSYTIKVAGKEGGDLRSDVTILSSKTVPFPDVDALKQKAEEGDASSEFLYGVLSESGWGVPQSFQVAKENYQKAAYQNNSAAQCALGQLYMHGRGTTQDYGQAHYWLDKADKAGDPNASVMIGETYLYGLGVPMDLSKSLPFFKKAADRGDATAEFYMGSLCYQTKEYDQALVWLQKASDQNEADGENLLAYMYRCGQGVDEDHDLEFELYSKSASAGNSAALEGLGSCYERGNGVPRDFAKALGLFQQAASQDIETAESELGFMYERGEGTPRDVNRALFWYRKAAKHGNVYAKASLYRLGDR